MGRGPKKSGNFRLSLHSEKLEKAVTFFSEPPPKKEGGHKVRGTVNPRFAAGLLFPKS